MLHVVLAHAFGPGTVVACSRAGAEFILNLIWGLVMAALIAFTLQEGTAWVTIVFGRSVGQCLKTMYSNAAILCWLVADSMFFGKMLFEWTTFHSFCTCEEMDC